VNDPDTILQTINGIDLLAAGIFGTIGYLIGRIVERQEHRARAARRHPSSLGGPDQRERNTP
jgi:hypothetical protein